MDRLGDSKFHGRTIWIALALLCFGLLPRVEAVVPAPDGGYPGHNTAEGQSALFSLTTGEWNTAVGFLSLGENTTGGFNTANGALALHENDTGLDNTANGYAALRSNTTGDHNTARRWCAYFNTTGERNTACGVSALFSNDTVITTRPWANVPAPIKQRVRITSISAQG